MFALQVRRCLGADDYFEAVGEYENPPLALVEQGLDERLRRPAASAATPHTVMRVTGHYVRPSLMRGWGKAKAIWRIIKLVVAVATIAFAAFAAFDLSFDVAVSVELFTTGHIGWGAVSAYISLQALVLSVTLLLLERRYTPPITTSPSLPSLESFADGLPFPRSHQMGRCPLPMLLPWWRPCRLPLAAA